MSPVRSRTTATVLAIALMCSLCVVPVGTAIAQQSETDQGYSISIDTPTDLVASDTQLIGVEMDNSEGDSDLFSPIVEIPLPEEYDVSSSSLDNAYVEYSDGTTAPVSDAEVLNSTFKSGDAVYLYGENIPQGDSHTYYVNVSIENPGSSTVEAETRLLYNENDESVTARTERDVSVSGFGNLSAQVERPGGAPVNADVTIDGSTVDSSGSMDVERVEGSYEIGAIAPSGAPVSLPSFTQTIGVNDDKSVSYTVPQSLENPTVIGTTQSASVADGSVGQETVQEPTATDSKQVTVSYLLRTSGGTAVVAVADPDIGPIDDTRGSSDSGTISLNTVDETTNVQIDAATDTTATITYDGYKLGDTDKNGGVTSTDAKTVAQTVAAIETGDEYYDVDGDGEITSTDAMYIAQYTDGNRNADYSKGAS